MQNKLEVKKIRRKTLQEWLPIQKIYEDGIVKTKDNRLIKNWTLKPLNTNCECKYFEKSDITFEEFIEKYYEI